MNLEQTESIVSIIQGVVTAGAITAGGIWAWYKFVLGHDHLWNLNLAIRHVVHPYTDGTKLLTIYVDLTNIGKIPIQPGKKGCEIKIAQLPKTFKPGETIEWEHATVIVKEYDIIAYRTGDFYTIEPGCTYTEIMNIVVESAAHYNIQARFWWKDNEDCITHHETVSVC